MAKLRLEINELDMPKDRCPEDDSSHCKMENCEIHAYKDGDKMIVSGELMKLILEELKKL